MRIKITRRKEQLRLNLIQSGNNPRLKKAQGTSLDPRQKAFGIEKSLGKTQKEVGSQNQGEENNNEQN